MSWLSKWFSSSPESDTPPLSADESLTSEGEVASYEGFAEIKLLMAAIDKEVVVMAAWPSPSIVVVMCNFEKPRCC